MYFILIIFSIGLSLLAQFLVNNQYNKYSKIALKQSITGEEVALKILEANGIYDVKIFKQDSGLLSDYYDPTKKEVHLSPAVFSGKTILSASVAAHEVGHAIQHHEKYSFIALRNKVLPAAMIGSQFGWIAIFIGIASNISFLFLAGVILIILLLLFQLVTLPVEINASTRAKKQLASLHVISADEESGVKNMLNAAAFTYIASFLTTILELVRLVLMNNNNK